MAPCCLQQANGRGGRCQVGERRRCGENAGRMARKYRYGEMTWPEVKAAAARPCVAIVPIATLEDHGPHLPIDTDLLLCASVCEEAASRAAGRVVLIPPINHGYTPHHLDFPGAITIGAHTLIEYGLDVCKSLAHHGFERILIVNGHGSNTPFA